MNRDGRIAQVQGFLKPGQGALLTEYAHRVFLLGFPSSAGTIFLTAEKRFFLVDFRYIEMARKIGAGFRVILQEDLAAQLQALAAENGITGVLTDREALTAKGFETIRRNLGQGILQDGPELSAFLRALEKEKTEDEQACLEKAKGIAARIEKRFGRFVREGASIESLRRRLGLIRGEEGDESRTFAAQFIVEGQDGPAGPLAALQAGSSFSVQFTVTVGLISCWREMRFPVKGLLPVPAQSRRAALGELLWEEHSAILLCSRPNIRYYLGADPGRDGGLLFTGKDILLWGEKGADVPGVTWLPGQQRGEYLEGFVAREGIQTIYTEEGIPLKCLGECKALPCRICPSGELEARIYRRRSVKAAEELDRLRAAQAVTDRVFLESLHYIRAGMSDVEIQRLIGLLFYEMGSQMDAFNHVCGCGPDTSLPHVRPSGRIAQRGDWVMLDIGAQVDGYGSDMTRMVGIGEVDGEKREIYALVLQAQEAAIRAVQAGAVCRDVDAAARDVIGGRGYGAYFLHGLGHPVGSGGREGPRFSQSDTSTLQPGVVMTVEPGIYLPGRFGVRIEDMVYVGEQGTENLTHSTKELICV